MRATHYVDIATLGVLTCVATLFACRSHDAVRSNRLLADILSSSPPIEGNFREVQIAFREQSGSKIIFEGKCLRPIIEELRRSSDLADQESPARYAPYGVGKKWGTLEVTQYGNLAQYPFNVLDENKGLYAILVPDESHPSASISVLRSTDGRLKELLL